MTLDDLATALAIQGVILAIVTVALVLTASFKADRGWKAHEAARPIRLAAWITFGLTVASWIAAAWVGAFA